MNIDKVGNKTRKEEPKRRHTSFQRKRGRFSKSIKHWHKENPHRNHSRFQILRKSVCYKIISAPTAHRVLVLKDQNEVKGKSSPGPCTCRLCFGQCLCVKVKDKEYESFIFNRLQHLRTENCRLHYMKKCSRTPLGLVTNSCSPDSLVRKMESDNKIPKGPQMNSSGQIQNSRPKTNFSTNSRFTSKLIGLVDSLGKTSSENTCSRSYKILRKDNINSCSPSSPSMAKNSTCGSPGPLLVDTELDRKVGANKQLFPKLKGDFLDSNNLKAIESDCKDTWYTFMPNVQISSKKRKEDIFSDCISSKKALCEELNFFSTKRGSIVCRKQISNPHKVPINIQAQEHCQILKSSGSETSQINLAVNSTTQCKIKKVSEKNGSKLFLDKLDNFFVKINESLLQNMYPSNRERSQATSQHLMDPRLDEKRILKRKAEPGEVVLKRFKWSTNMAASSYSNNMKHLGNIKPGHTLVHKNTNVENDISSLQDSLIRKELVDPRFKHSKIFPSNPSLCDNKQYSPEKTGITDFALKQNETPSSSKLSVKSRGQELPTKHTYSNPVTLFTSIPSQVSSSKMSFKTSVCASSVTSTKCTYSHPTLPKTKKQGVPELQRKCADSRSPTDFTSPPASPSALSVKTSVCLPSETQANCTNEHLTSASDTSVKANLHVLSENQAKRTHDSSTLLKMDEHEVVPKKRAKYSSHHSPLSLNKCDINISSVQTASGSAISVKILEYNNSTGKEINVEVLSQQMQVGKTASALRKNITGTNELRVKKFVKNQASCDISKETRLSPSPTLTSTVQSSDNPLSSCIKKSTTTFSTSKVFYKRKGQRLGKPTSSSKYIKESSSQLHSKQACSEITSNKKSMSKSIWQEYSIVPKQKCDRTSVSNDKLSLPNPKRQGHSKSLKKYKQKIYKRNIKSLVGTFKKHFKVQCHAIGSCVSLNNTAAEAILPFDFKVEEFMEEVSCAPIEPRFKNFKLSTIWGKTLCAPLKYAGRLSWECYLNSACSDSITKPATAMEIFEQFLQNRLSMHLIKHSSLGLVGIMKYFALIALKLFKSKMRRKQSNSKNCPNPPTSSKNPILTLQTCLDTLEGLPGNSLKSHHCKIESVGNKVGMVDSKKFSISTMWIKKDLEWEMFFQCSNLMVCFNLENLKKDSISLLLSKKGISFHALDRFNFLMKREDKIQMPNAYMLQEQFLCNVYTDNENFLSSVILGTPEGMFLNTYCQELQYSDFAKEKRLKRSNVSIYKFLCNNYRSMNVFKSMGLNTLLLKSNRLFSQDESLDASSEKYSTFSKLENEQIYFVKPEMLPSKLSVTYKMPDKICIKKDPKCLIFNLQEITCKLRSDSKGFLQKFDSSCVMKKEIGSENAINLPTTDTYKSEPGVSYKNNCIVNTEMETTKFSKNLKFQTKDHSTNKVVDPSCEFNDTDKLSQPQEELVHGTTTIISTSLQLPASKVNSSVITAVSATSVQLHASQEQSCNGLSTSALTHLDLKLPALEDQKSNGLSITALVPQSEKLSNGLSVTNIQVPQSKEPLPNGFPTAVSKAANVELLTLQESSSSGLCSTSAKATNVQMHTSEVQPYDCAHTTVSNPTSVQLHALQEQSCNDLFTSALTHLDLQSPALEDQKSNGLSITALDVTNMQVPQSEELSNGFSTSALSVKNMQVPRSKTKLSNALSTTTLSVTNIQVPQSKELLSNGFSTAVSNVENVKLLASSRGLRNTSAKATNIQMHTSEVQSYNSAHTTVSNPTSVQLHALQEQSCNDLSTSALTHLDLQSPALEDQKSNGLSITALHVTNTQVPQSEKLSNGFSTSALSVKNVQVPQSKKKLCNGFSTAVSNVANVKLLASSRGLCNTSAKATNIQMHTSEVQSYNRTPTTVSNPTSVQLPVLEEQTAKVREGRNESICKDMNNLNDIALKKASLADTNIKSQALSEDFYSLLDSLSNLLENNHFSDAIDSDESLRNSTESEMLSQDESDSSLLDNILEYYESSIANSSENSQKVQTVSKCSNKSLLSVLQEISMPSLAEINSGTELCSSHVSLLASSKNKSAPNLGKQKTCSSQVFSRLSQPSSKDNRKLNISQKKIRSPHYSPKTSEKSLLSKSQETSMPVIAQRNIESIHFSDLASSKGAIASNSRKRKLPDCSPEVATKLFASSKKSFMPNIAPKETAAKASSLELPKQYFKQSQDSACCSSVVSLNLTTEPKNTSSSPVCENSCTGAVASSEVFQTDCHLKGKKLNMSCDTLNFAFHDFDLFEEGKPLRRYYQHLIGTGNHVLNLDCICKDKTELSGEMLESYNFLKDQLDYHQCLLRGLIHTASDPDTDCDMQMDRRIANELEYIDGYELACQALLL